MMLKSSPSLRPLITWIAEACAWDTLEAVMQRGPGWSLYAVEAVDLPFPRERTSDAFMAIFRQVHALIHEEIHPHE